MLNLKPIYSLFSFTFIKSLFNSLLSAIMVDRLSLLVYSQSKDAKTGRNKPKLLLEELYKQDKMCYGFDNPDDLKEALERIKRGA